MDREALRQRLMLTFLGELEEHVQTMTRDLLALEKSGESERADRVTSLFRTAHSLKGAARAVSLPGIEKACHQLETLFSKHRRSVQQLDHAAVQLLYRTADALKATSVRLRDAVVDPEEPMATMLPGLTELARRAPDVAPPPRVPSPESPAFARSASARPRQGLSVSDDTTSGGGRVPNPESPVPSPESRIPDPQSPIPNPQSRVPSPAPSAGTPRDPIVRVAADKLDALLTASGELLVARKRAGVGPEAATALHDEVRRWRAEWTRIEAPLRRLIASQPKAIPRRVRTTLAGTGARLHALERRAEQLASTLVSERHRLDRAADDLDNGIRRVRMFPLNDACEGLELTVRELAHQNGKRAELTIHGGEIELGRLLLDGLRDPLLHLIRNAMAHGIESPDERVAAGKPPTGAIAIAASLRGSHVEIVVADDGRGLDVSAIREHASRQGLPAPATDRDAAGLVFLPEFTTARAVTELSGRGMGLEIVRERIGALHGRADVTSEAGRGTRVALTIPLNLVRLRALHIGAGGQVYALPVANVVRLARVGRSDLGSVGGREVLLSGDAPVPIVRLVELLGVETTAPAPSASRVPVVVVTAGNGTIALAVDELIAEEEILVKNLGARLRRLRHFSGATILSSGRVALILNAADVVRTAGAAAAAQPLATALAPPNAARRRILVVDDSITTRSLEKSILEASGYEVVVAADGAEGWRLLQERGADLVVADVEMPSMSGFTLCETIRASARFPRLPVILVTGLAGDHDRARGLAAGADAYLPKSAFDQQLLLDTIARLL